MGSTYIIQRNLKKKYQSCLVAFVCIPEFLTHLLTPILPFLERTCKMAYASNMAILIFWHNWHIRHPKFVMFSQYGCQKMCQDHRNADHASKQFVHGFNSVKCQITDLQFFCLLNFLCVMLIGDKSWILAYNSRFFALILSHDPLAWICIWVKKVFLEHPNIHRSWLYKHRQHALHAAVVKTSW